MKDNNWPKDYLRGFIVPRKWSSKNKVVEYGLIDFNGREYQLVDASGKNRLINFINHEVIVTGKIFPNNTQKKQKQLYLVKKIITIGVQHHEEQLYPEYNHAFPEEGHRVNLPNYVIDGIMYSNDSYNTHESV